METLPDREAEKREKEFVDYQILTFENYEEDVVNKLGFGYPVFSDSERMRALYINRTDTLISEMEQQQVDSVIYLDRSARPIQWFVKELWPIFAPGKKMPESKFVNIDASSLLGRDAESSRPEVDDIFTIEIRDEYVQELRETFRDPQDKTKSLFDGKKVMIVDEVSVTGSTLAVALKIFKAAFPEAEFIARSWMSPEIIQRKDRKLPAEIPVWYSPISSEGRAVGEVAEGSHFISTRLVDESGKPDPKSIQLRNEIKRIAHDVQAGEQSIIPSHNRNSDFYFETETDDSGNTVEKVGDDGRPVSRFNIKYVK